MKLKDEKVRNQKLYYVGYCEYLDKYVLATTVAWVAWYNRYYEISKEEYLSFDSDIEKLDMLAKECNKLENLSERFLFSDKLEENTPEQTALMKNINAVADP